MLEHLNFNDIIDNLYEIADNGDPCGYNSDEEGYYQEYKPFFDELSAGAYSLIDTLTSEYGAYSFEDIKWDEITVALLGETQCVLGYDVEQQDYYNMLNPCYEDCAIEVAEQRLEKLTKKDLIRNFRQVLTTLILYFDIKSAHDCLTSIVQELDERSALLEQKNEKINEIYEDLTGKNGEEFDRIIKNIPPRMWVE